MSETIKAGSIVTLKSGGPRMTVREVDARGQTAFCEWYLFDKAPWKLEENEFLLSSLMLLNVQPKPGFESPGIHKI